MKVFLDAREMVDWLAESQPQGEFCIRVFKDESNPSAKMIVRQFVGPGNVIYHRASDCPLIVEGAHIDEEADAFAFRLVPGYWNKFQGSALMPTYELIEAKSEAFRVRADSALADYVFDDPGGMPTKIAVVIAEGEAADALVNWYYGSPDYLSRADYDMARPTGEDPLEPFAQEAQAQSLTDIAKCVAGLLYTVESHPECANDPLISNYSKTLGTLISDMLGNRNPKRRKSGNRSGNHNGDDKR